MSTIIAIGNTAFRRVLQKQVGTRTMQLQRQHRRMLASSSLLIKQPVASSTRPAPPSGSSPFIVDADAAFSTGIDHVVDGVMNKDFPGYFDKDHHRTHSPQAPVLDVHRRAAEKAERNVLDDESLDPIDHDLEPAFGAEPPAKMSCHKVAQIVEQHHSVDECLVVDINVKEMNAGEIPVAFVVPKQDALKYIDPDNKIHDALLQSVKAVLGSTQYHQKHQELSRDIINKLDDMLLNDKSIREDMIRDEIVQCVRNKYGRNSLIKIVFVDAIPRTASGKAMRGTLYKIGRGEPFTITKLIMDHEALRKVEKEIKLLVGIIEEDDKNVQPQEVKEGNVYGA